MRAAAAPEIQRAPAGKCEFIMRNEAGKLHECGSPATLRGVKGRRMFYCEAHGHYVSAQRNGIGVERIAPAPVRLRLSRTD